MALFPNAGQYLTVGPESARRRESALKAELIDGKKIAAEVRAEVAAETAELKAAHGVTPGLAVVLVGDDPASAVYVRSKQQAATEAGMTARDVSMPGSTSQGEIIDKVGELGEDDEDPRPARPAPAARPRRRRRRHRSR